MDIQASSSSLLAGAVTADRLRARVARCAETISATRDDVVTWVTARRGERLFRRFASHLDVLESVLLGVLDRIAAAQREQESDAGAEYARCRRIDRCTAVVRAVWIWYAVKYDQRLSGQPHADLLASADAITLSCWQEPFRRAFRTPPTGPLCFVDDRSDGHVLRRCSVPGELKLTGDQLVDELITELPVPIIALPEGAGRGAWWLAVTAHETGHHVEHDLGLNGAVRDALSQAVPQALRSSWRAWSGEVFADAYAVVMLGPAAVWPIEELQFGPAGFMLQATKTYPAPLVRLALLVELLRQLGAKEPLFGAEEALSQLEDLAAGRRERTMAHLGALPEVANGLLELSVGGGALGTFADPSVIQGTGLVMGWAEQLGREDRVISPKDGRSAPRLLLAAAARRHRTVVTPDDLAGLHGNLLAELAGSGAPGVLADDARVLPAGLADRLADRLLAAGGVA
ncbi:hypothetical protein [Amycolatopsis sp. NPDC098790]|uniref:hypothetical protein n=1 Tax=Amycolatopsis sp. NPDC098790 TaxID=3363939 RepID=UPI00382045B9